MKKFLAVLLAVMLVVATFAACSSQKTDDNASTEAGATNTVDTANQKVGILQFMPHPSLDNCTQGVKNVLDKAGISYEVQIGSAGSADADCQSYAQQMVADGCTAIVAVATPAAMDAFGAVQNAGVDTPVIFCAVSDPVAAGLVKTLDEPGSSCTGTSDAFDIDGQVELIKTLQPDVKTLGVLYTVSEANSLSQLKTLEAACEKAGIELVSQGINDATELPSASVTLVSKVDAITNLTDNNVVENMATVLQNADEAGVPVYGSEIEQVKNGCIASASLDYVALGEKTGDIVVDVLGGKATATYPVVTVTDSFLVINTDITSKFNISIPESLADVETVTTNQE